MLRALLRVQVGDASASAAAAAAELRGRVAELELERDALRASLEEEVCARGAAEKRSERATSLQVVVA